MSKRLEKINELLMQLLSLMIQRKFASEFGFININSVISNPDLKSAKVYISVLDQKKSQQLTNLLRHESHNFHKELAKKLSMKFIPKLEYVIDESQNQIDQIDQLLVQIKNEK